MRSKLVQRHYCDHCSKGFFKKPSCFNHEITCFSNPKRQCPFCITDNVEPKPVAELLKVLEEHGDAALPTLRELTGNCPGCIMAALIQHYNACKHLDPEERPWIEFKYKEEVAEWHSNQDPWKTFGDPSQIPF